MPNALVLVGEIGRPHGVRGLVRLRSFTADPAAIASYGPLSDEGGGRRFVLEWLGNGLARIEGVEDRDAAARLTGLRLYVPRDRLPPPGPGEFYLVDLIGLAAEDEAGVPLGTVRAVEDFGAGAFLTLSDGGEERLIPFTELAVPVVDIPGGRIVVRVPEERVIRPEEEAEAGLSPAPPRALPRRREG
ncbi:MAG: ribosome maturation factor RimM, partial [Acetobacteraceae bacterium]|nr:ribosome maturation factor RimM [Acetobacteraceae bacterium]